MVENLRGMDLKEGPEQISLIGLFTAHSNFKKPKKCLLLEKTHEKLKTVAILPSVAICSLSLFCHNHSRVFI